MCSRRSTSFFRASRLFRVRAPSCLPASVSVRHTRLSDHVQALSTVLIHCVSLRCAAVPLRCATFSLRCTALFALYCVVLSFTAVVNAAGPIMESRVPVEQPQGNGAQHRHRRHRDAPHACSLLLTPKATARAHVSCWVCDRHSRDGVGRGHGVGDWRRNWAVRAATLLARWCRRGWPRQRIGELAKHDVVTSRLVARDRCKECVL